MSGKVYGLSEGDSLEVYGLVLVDGIEILFKTGMAWIEDKQIGVENAFNIIATGEIIEWANKEDEDLTVHFNGGVGLRFNCILSVKLFSLAMVG